MNNILIIDSKNIKIIGTLYYYNNKLFSGIRSFSYSINDYKIYEFLLNGKFIINNFNYHNRYDIFNDKKYISLDNFKKYISLKAFE